MDLVTLIAACSIGGFDPAITRSVVTLSSYAEPWSYRIEGERNAKVFDTPHAAIAGARQAQELGRSVRVGLGGIAVDLLAKTAQPNEAMFSPCVNISVTTRRLSEASERCAEAGRPDPDYCAVGVYFGSWEQPDQAMVDASFLQVASQQNEPSPEIEDFGSGAGSATTAEPGQIETEAPALSEEEKQRQEFLAGGGGLFPKATAQDKELQEDPERGMIFEPGRGFENSDDPDSQADGPTVLVPKDSNSE